MYRCNHAAANGATARVMTNPPMNPSHVFFGEILISGVRPHVNPTRYAAMSLKKTMASGYTNQIRPSRTFPTKHDDCINTVAMIMCVHANCPNWYTYKPLRRERTKRMKPNIHPRYDMSEWCARKESPNPPPGSVATLAAIFVFRNRPYVKNTATP